MAESPLLPFTVASDVQGVSVSGDTAFLTSGDGFPPVGVLTIPPGVFSFSFALCGGGTAFGEPGTVPVAFFDVPCTPGEEWLLEGGDGPLAANEIISCKRNTYQGGDGGNGTFVFGFGFAGGGASRFSRRTGGVEWAVAGGRGGFYNPPVGGGVPAADGPVTVTAPGAASGSHGTTGAFAAGGGGGGHPGGAGGAAPGDGESGGSRYPTAPGGSLGGLPSPTWTEWTGAAFPVAGYVVGQVWAWWFPPAVSGWTTGSVGFDSVPSTALG